MAVRPIQQGVFTEEDKVTIDNFFKMIKRFSEIEDLSLIIGGKICVKMGGPYRWVVTEKSDDAPGTYFALDKVEKEGLYKNQDENKGGHLTIEEDDGLEVIHNQPVDITNRITDKMRSKYGLKGRLKTEVVLDLIREVVTEELKQQVKRIESGESEDDINYVEIPGIVSFIVNKVTKDNKTGYGISAGISKQMVMDINGIIK